MQKLRAVVLKNTLCTITSLFLLFPFLQLNATPLVDVIVQDHETARMLAAGNYDVIEWKADYARIVAWPGDMERLNASGFNYSIFIEDIEAHNRETLENSLDDMGGYPTLSEIEAWFDAFLLDHSDIVSSLDTIGYTVENRPLTVFKISDNPNTDEEDETEIYINATIHAREVTVPVVTMNFCDMIADGYGSDARMTELIDNNEIWFQIIANPDGYVYNETTNPNGGGMHRKNRSLPDGVDLNRNFPFMWGLDDQGSSPYQDDETYRGPSAGSEPETQAMMDFINDHHFAAVMNYHTFSDLLLIPWGYTYDPHENRDVYMAYGNYMCENLDYEIGGAEVIYTTNGDASDWQAAGGLESGAEYEMYAFVFEVGSGFEGSRYVGFWPSYGLSQTYATQHEEPLMRFCEMASDPTPLLPPMPPVIALEDTVTTSFTLSWSPIADEYGNDAIAYDVAEMYGLEIEDGAEEADIYAWDLDGFTLSTTRHYEGEYSYYSNSGSNMNNSMTTKMPYHVHGSDVLTLMANYEIEDGWDYAYVQVSTDGKEFHNLQGNITTNDNPEGANRGNGITGNSNGWVNATFSLFAYAGNDVFFRIAYDTDDYTNEEGFYFDNFTPIMAFESFEQIATAIPDTFIALEYVELEEMCSKWYSVRAIDEQDDVSKWSAPIETVINPETSEVNGNDKIPAEFTVGELYPNPFNPSTSLELNLPQSANLKVRLYDILGREALTVTQGLKAAGKHSLSINASGLATGLYFVVVDANGQDGTNYHSVRKAIFMK